MKYYMISDENYIYTVSKSFGSKEISEETYNKIQSIITAIPAAPEGMVYMLTTDLELELITTPPPPPDREPDADISDYQSALSELGVSV